MDFFIDIGEKFPVKSVEELRQIFFKYHTYKKRERRNERFAVMNPLVLILNPPQYVNDLEDKWFAVYHRKFFVTITEGKGMFGPHIACLYLQVYQGYNAWLGTAQIKCNFFDRKTIRRKLRIAIKNKNYYISEKSGGEVVDFTPQHVDEIEVKI